MADSSKVRQSSAFFQAATGRLPMPLPMPLPALRPLWQAVGRAVRITPGALRLQGPAT